MIFTLIIFTFPVQYHIRLFWSLKEDASIFLDNKSTSKFQPVLSPLMTYAVSSLSSTISFADCRASSSLFSLNDYAASSLSSTDFAANSLSSTISFADCAASSLSPTECAASSLSSTD